MDGHRSKSCPCTTRSSAVNVADRGAIHPALALCRIEVTFIGVHVANLGRADDLELGVTLGDDVALGDVARTDPFRGQQVAVAEREKL